MTQTATLPRTSPAASAGLQINEPEAGGIGAEVRGLDLNALATDAPEIRVLRDLIYRNKLLTIRNQALSMQEYIDFARKIGRPQVYFQPQYHHPDHPEIFVSSNMLENGKKVGVAGTGRYWHTDCQFEKQPLSLTSIQPVVFPKTVRGTHYIDMSRVYAELPAHLRRYVDGATCVHEGKLRYKVQASDIDKSLIEILDRIHHEVPPVEHPAVIEHPVTGVKILYMSSGFTTKIKGLSYEENERVIGEVFAFAEQPHFIHTHVWDEGDIILWDNRYLNHRSSDLPKGEHSKSYRIGIYDAHAFYVGLAQ